MARVLVAPIKPSAAIHVVVRIVVLLFCPGFTVDLPNREVSVFE